MNWYKFSQQNIDTSYLSIKRYWENRYPIKSSQQNDSVDNVGSISSTFDNWEELKGIREVLMSDFGGPNSVFYAVNDFNHSKNLAAKIKESGYVSPLIIVIDKEGPYILEGSHRYVALYYLGAKTLPALVVMDINSFEEEENNNVE